MEAQLAREESERPTTMPKVRTEEDFNLYPAVYMYMYRFVSSPRIRLRIALCIVHVSQMRYGHLIYARIRSVSV